MNIDELKYLLFQTKDNIGLLTINREEKLNALSLGVLQELKEFLTWLEEGKDLSLSGMILIGAGSKSFVAGADIEEMSRLDKSGITAFATSGEEVAQQLENLPFPVIAAVNGHALGGGLEMALACDFIFASKNAFLGLPEVKLGLIPGFGGTQRLVSALGLRAAKEAIYSGRMIAVEEALQKGLILQSWETRDELLEGCLKEMIRIVKNSKTAIAAAKGAMQNTHEVMFGQGLVEEKKLFVGLFGTEDQKEGVAAFLEKRSAIFGKGQ